MSHSVDGAISSGEDMRALNSVAGWAHVWMTLIIKSPLSIDPIRSSNTKEHFVMAWDSNETVPTFETHATIQRLCVCIPRASDQTCEHMRMYYQRFQIVEAPSC